MSAKTPNNEITILSAAIQALEAETGLRLEVEREGVWVEDRTVDAELRLTGFPDTIAAEVKNWAPHANWDVLLYQLQRLPAPASCRMLVADYVNPRMAARLKAEGIQFIDTMGNAYINLPPVYIYVTGQGKARKMAAPKGNRAFEPTGLKVVFAFLCNPELANAPYRTIADLADVALGTVGWVKTGLKDAGLLTDKGRNKGGRLTNYQKLLDRWVEAYPQKLKPKQYIGTFVAENFDWWKDLDITKYGALLGGEMAAARLTNYLKPKTTTLYTKDVAFQNKLFAKARFRKADALQEDMPAIKVYRQFWSDAFNHPDNTLPPGIVHPVLIYADLIASGDARNREVAGEVYERYIAQYCREN